jgi:hypothetical protein
MSTVSDSSTDDTISVATGKIYTSLRNTGEGLILQLVPYFKNRWKFKMVTIAEHG